MKVTHIACPQCRKNGKDRKGDNLAVYPDGGSFCFSCGYHESGKKYLPKMREDRKVMSFPHTKIPESHYGQLSKYLTDEEIKRHFTFDPHLGRLVLLDTLPDFYWGRDGHNGRTKVFTLGDVPFYVFSSRVDLGCRTLVVVEDPISAIVVSRVYNALPLFGAHLPTDWYRKFLYAGNDLLVFWLDRNKAKESMKLAMSFRHLIHTDFIVSPKDPKAYSVADIQQYMEKVEVKEDPIPF
jgi:hypothetical protein